MIQIVPFEEKHKADFSRLNLEWLDKYHLTESHDLQVLNDPSGTILEHGGCIFLAVDGEQVVGSAALMNEGDGRYELAKMAVSSAYQGRGISRMLMDACMQKAKDLKAKKILLYSNSQLQRAIKLYSSYGFQHVEVIDSPFVTADVKMEKNLD